MDAPKPKDPWEYFAAIAKAANETGLDYAQAFRFMSALGVQMQVAQVPLPPESTAKPS